MKRRTFLAALGASSFGASSLAVFRLASAAEAYPTAPVKLIVPYAAGGGLDTVTRILAKGMGEDMKQPFVVDNRPGGGGMIGAGIASKAAPDGYTILMAGNPELTITPYLEKASYSAVKDFTPIALVAQSPNLIVANASLGAKNLRDALNAAEKTGTGIAIGTPGNGSPQHIAVEVLKAQTGLKITHVPYKGAAPAVTAVLGGEVPFSLIGAPPVIPHLKSGKLVALAVTQPKRSPLVPDVPTMGEAMNVMANDDFVTWYGMLAPARTPADVVQALEKAAFAVLKRPDTKPQFAALGTDLVAMPSAQFAERMRHDSAMYSELIKKLGIKAS
jgi:tripartite-type tricarboxylate transporter receptor subunit TctC